MMESTVDKDDQDQSKQKKVRHANKPKPPSLPPQQQSNKKKQVVDVVLIKGRLTDAPPQSSEGIAKEVIEDKSDIVHAPDNKKRRNNDHTKKKHNKEDNVEEVKTTESSSKNTSSIATVDQKAEQSSVPVKGLIKLPSHLLQQVLKPPGTTTTTATTATKTASKKSHHHSKDKKAKNNNPSPPPPLPPSIVEDSLPKPPRLPRPGIDIPKSKAKKDSIINMEDYINNTARNEVKFLKYKTVYKHLETELEKLLQQTTSSSSSSNTWMQELDICQESLFQTCISMLQMLNEQENSFSDQYKDISLKSIHCIQKFVKIWKCQFQSKVVDSNLITTKSEALALYVWNIYEVMKQNASFQSLFAWESGTVGIMKEQEIMVQLLSSLFATLGQIFTFIFQISHHDNHAMEAHYYLNLAISIYHKDSQYYFMQYQLYGVQQEYLVVDRALSTMNMKVLIVEYLRKRMIALFYALNNSMNSSSSVSMMWDDGTAMDVWSYQEILSTLLEHCKLESSQEIQSANTSNKQAQDHYYGMHISAFIAIAMIFNRVDIDKCQDYVELCRKHFILMLQTLTQHIQLETERNKVTDWQSKYSKEKDKSIGSLLEDAMWFNTNFHNDHVQIKELKSCEECCYEVLLLIGLLLQYLAFKHQQNSSSSSAFKSYIELIDGNSMSSNATISSGTVDNVQRYATQHLQHIQSSAGVVDSLKFLVGMISTYVFGTTSTISSHRTRIFYTQENRKISAIRFVVVSKSIHLFSSLFPHLIYTRYLPLLIGNEFMNLQEAVDYWLSQVSDSNIVGQLQEQQISQLAESSKVAAFSCNGEVCSILRRLGHHLNQIQTLPSTFDTSISFFEQRIYQEVQFDHDITLLRLIRSKELFKECCKYLLALQFITNSSVINHIVFDRQRKAFVLRHEEFNAKEDDKYLRILNNSTDKVNSNESQLKPVECAVPQVTAPSGKSSTFAIQKLPTRNISNNSSSTMENMTHEFQKMMVESVEELAVHTVSEYRKDKLDEELIEVKSSAAGMLNINSANIKQPSKKIAISKPNKVPSLVSLPIIVLDAANIAMRHGLNATFSCQGIQIVMRYFMNLGHKVIGFLPDYYMSYDRVGTLRKMTKFSIQDIDNVKAKIPDDIAMLESFVQDGLLVCTPPQDYDDAYCIEYAQRHRGYIITNDLYRDYIERQKHRDEARKWVKEHCISFTFVRNEFMPNPQAKFIPY